MPIKPLSRIIAVLLTLIVSATARISDSSAYQPFNAAELLLSETSLIVAAVDDWGLNGSLRHFGLPEYTLQINYHDFRQSDPLYGTVPLAWINSRHQVIDIDRLNNRIYLAPVYADSGVNLSRFDYYRGDYGFLNFAAIVAGDIAENIHWRLFGENLGYDGAYGVLGPDYAKLKESIVQNYYLDIKKVGTTWQTELGCSYQKYFPGMTNPAVLSRAGDETILSWSHAGRLKQYRTSLYVTGERVTDRGKLKTGLQMTNILYNTRHDSAGYAFTAEAFHYSGIFTGDLRAWSGDLHIRIEPVLESIYVRGGSTRTRSHFRQSIRYSRSGSGLDYSAALGSVNSYLTAELTADFNKRSEWLDIYFRSAVDFFQYPLIYFTDLAGKTGANPADDGFSAIRQTLGLRLNSRKSYLNSRLDYTKTEFLIPSKTAIQATHFTLQKESLNNVYLTEEFFFHLPWQIRLKGRIVITPRRFDDEQFLLQGWMKMTKDQLLFDDNLHLYVSGELHYLKGSNSLIWFEQLQTQAVGNVNYYTNERLTANGTAGARIGSFHIFYAVYNIEGRAFSALPGMPYRNRLKIFGVDWTFLNK